MIDRPVISRHDEFDEWWRTAAHEARQKRDASELLRIGGELERQGMFADAWTLLAEGGEIKRPPQLPMWGGPAKPAGRLLVRRRIRHLGAELRNARFIACAARDAVQVMVATENRLIPLLGRSFAEAQFVDVNDPAALDGADCEASYERLALHYGDNVDAITRSFRPLVAPPRNAVARGVGIAWFSSNGRKQLPTTLDWAELLKQVEGPIQSLQYDEQEAGLPELEALSGRTIAGSPFDQKQDVDAFAALVASVRSVITISNTTAHMAGALGIPCVVILDDLDHLTWPAKADRTPFYPALRVVRQRGRPWPVALQEASAVLQGLVNPI